MRGSTRTRHAAARKQVLSPAIAENEARWAPAQPTAQNPTGESALRADEAARQQMRDTARELLTQEESGVAVPPRPLPSARELAREFPEAQPEEPRYRPNERPGLKVRTRSDARIRSELLRQLGQLGQEGADSLDVQVHHGTVTLSGSVRLPRTKREIERACERVPGIAEIKNDLRVHA
jgi:osmotically-inducible protein OsmY